MVSKQVFPVFWARWAFPYIRFPCKIRPGVLKFIWRLTTNYFQGRRNTGLDVGLFSATASTLVLYSSSICWPLTKSYLNLCYSCLCMEKTQAGIQRLPDCKIFDRLGKFYGNVKNVVELKLMPIWYAKKVGKWYPMLRVLILIFKRDLEHLILIQMTMLSILMDKHTGAF